MVNSRDKGNRGERELAKQFKDWYGSEFTKTPLSGGFATPKFREDWNAAGDLVTPDEAFPFCVESKWVENWTLDQLLESPKCIILHWWEQTINECPEGKIPLLIFRKNRHPAYCMLPQSNVPFELRDSFTQAGCFTYTIGSIRTIPITTVYISLLSNLFNTEPTLWT